MKKLSKFTVLLTAMIFILAGTSLSAQAENTRTFIINFFKLSQNDFEVDSKSKVLVERQAYKDLAVADTEGGSPDGKITYSEYLNYLNKTNPGSITSHDFALSQVLPLLKDFAFGPMDVDIGSGVLEKPWVINSQLTIPAGSRVELKIWGSVFVFAKRDFEVQGLLLRGNGIASVQIDFSGSQFYLSSCQIAKDVVIDGIPCKAIFSSQDPNLSLYPNGKVRQAILSDNFTCNDIVFLSGERLQFNPDGSLYAAVLLKTRTIQGNLISSSYIEGNPKYGFWGGICPHVFFENGKVVACYEEDKKIGNITLLGINLYQYGSSESQDIRGIASTVGYFLGYPVALPKPQETSNWKIPSVMPITVEGNKASFLLDVALKISGTKDAELLPVGTKLFVDITTGNCLLAIFPDGQILTYTVSDQMKPVQLQKDLPVQIIEFMEQWLINNPESVDGSNKNIRQAHMDILKKMKLIIEQKEADSLRSVRYEELVKLLTSNGVFLYKNPVLGATEGNVAVDINGDNVMQSQEIIIIPKGQNYSAKSLLEALLERISDYPQSLQIKLVQLFAEGQKQDGLVEETDPIQKTVDLLGATLSRKGIHPLKNIGVYYLPDHSGHKINIANGKGKVLFSEKTPGLIRYAESNPRGRATFKVILRDGQVVDSDMASWDEATGLFGAGQFNGGAFIAIPTGNIVWANYIAHYPVSGKIWIVKPAGDKLIMPNGLEVIEPNGATFSESGTITEVLVSERFPISLSFKAGQKIMLTEFPSGSKTNYTFTKDTVISKFDGRIHFNEKGEIIQLDVWEPLSKKM